MKLYKYIYNDKNNCHSILSSLFYCMEKILYFYLFIYFQIDQIIQAQRRLYLSLLGVLLAYLYCLLCSLLLVGSSVKELVLWKSGRDLEKVGIFQVRPTMTILVRPQCDLILLVQVQLYSRIWLLPKLQYRTSAIMPALFCCLW